MFNSTPLGDIALIKQGRYLAPTDLSDAKTEHSPIPVWGANGLLGYTAKPTYDLPQPLVTCRGNGCGLVQWTGGPANISNNSMAIVIQNSEPHTSRYLYYCLLSSDFSDVTTGSAQPQITVTHLKDKEIFWTENSSEQKAIAHILGTLDEKIELNRKTNETLEGIAKALFKSWFVDFDPARAKAEGRPTGLPDEISELFPDSFEESELGEIPSGWNIKAIEEIAEKIAMGPFGSNIKVSTFVDSGIPVISGQHLKGAILHDGGNNFVTPEHAEKLKNSCVGRGDIVFTHAGSIGQVSIIPVNSKYERYVISQRQFYLRPVRNNLSHYLTMFFRSRNGQHVLLSNSSQTGVPSIARPASFLKSIQTFIPSAPLLDAFDFQVKTIFVKTRSITDQNLILSQLRDALLPRLISGELRVPDAEKMLEEVGI